MTTTTKTTSAPLLGGIPYACLALLSLAMITSLAFIPILVIGIFKLFPNERWRIFCTKGIDHIAVIWTGFTTGYVNRFYPVQWNITGATKFKAKKWYLVIANHQSWLDIIILQNLFYRKIPVLKFFIKEELKWVPLLGFAWWAMGCPFMKRYSKAYIEKNPHKKTRDMEATHRALKLFKTYPSSIISFVEGTRLTPEKKLHQQSPYQHLLKPKAGGISQVIGVMGNQLQPIIDVTIVYPTPNTSLWDFLCGRIRSIDVNIRELDVPKIFKTSTGLNDDYTQSAFRAWLNEQWASKDELIMNIKQHNSDSSNL